MHPLLFRFGQLAVTTEGVLVGLGVLGGMQLASRLATRRGLPAERIWNLGLVALLTLLLGQRMLMIAFHLSDFIHHPLWMLGLAVVRDERYFYGAAVLALCAGVIYALAWRLPGRATMDCLAPGAALVLACASLGSLAAGSDYGRPTSAWWGIVYTSPLAARIYGTPLGVPLIPIALYAALMQLLLAMGLVWLWWRPGLPSPRPAGSAAAFWLFAAGLGTLLLEQWRYRFADETLVAGVFTPAQMLGLLAVCMAALLWLRPPAAKPAMQQ